MFVKTFKGYEDRIGELDESVNAWVAKHGPQIQIVDIKVALAHEPGSGSGMGDLIYCVVYRAHQPVAEQESMLPAGFEL